MPRVPRTAQRRVPFGPHRVRQRRSRMVRRSFANASRRATRSWRGKSRRRCRRRRGSPGSHASSAHRRCEHDESHPRSIVADRRAMRPSVGEAGPHRGQRGAPDPAVGGEVRGACNIRPTPEIPRQLGLLQRLCVAAGRDYAAIDKSAPSFSTSGLTVPGSTGWSANCGGSRTRASTVFGWVVDVDRIRPIEIMEREVIPWADELAAAARPEERDSTS